MISFRSFALTVLAGFGVAGSPFVAAAAQSGSEPAASSLQFAATLYAIPADSATLTVAVTRTGNLGGAVAASFSTAGGTAVSGVNFEPVGGRLSWAVGESSTKSIVIAVKNVPGKTEVANFTLILFSPEGPAVIGPNSTATVTLTAVPLAGSIGAAARLLSYLAGLDKGSSRRVLSGQHADIWNADPASTTEPMDVVDPLVAATGENPSILGLVLNFATGSGAYDVGVTDTLARQWWSKGGVVMLSLYDNDPTFSYNRTGAPIGRPIPGWAFHSLTVKSSAAYRQWHSQLDTYAAALHTLTDSGNVVLFRPFIEINGDWNWYGAENPADFIAVWRDMHDYLENTKSVRNLLWIYDVNQDVGRYVSYFPGASFVDVVGMDIYNSHPTSDPANGSMYAQLVATGKPLIVPEIGLGYSAPARDTQFNPVIVDSIRSAYPHVVGFVVFNSSFAVCNQLDASVLMNDPWIVNLGNLPGGL